MNNRGFTLIELLVVIAIIGILAGAAYTAYVGLTTSAARSEAYGNLDSIHLLQKQYYADNGKYAGSNLYLGTEYSATPLSDTDEGIEDLLTDFRPGGCTLCDSPYGLHYTYSMSINFMIVDPSVPFADADARAINANESPCFIAVAEGIIGTRTEGDRFAIDCNNVKNY